MPQCSFDGVCLRWRQPEWGRDEAVIVKALGRVCQEEDTEEAKNVGLEVSIRQMELFSAPLSAFSVWDRMEPI